MKIDICFTDSKCIRQYEPVSHVAIDADDEAVWAEFIKSKIEALLVPESKDTLEFKLAEAKVRVDREWERRQERRREKKRVDDQRHKVMQRPRINFIPKGLSVDYEKEYAVFLEQEVTYCPIDAEDFLFQLRLLNRLQEKSVPQIIEMGRPDAAYAIAIDLCRYITLFLNRDDLQEYFRTYKTRVRKLIVDSFSALSSSVRAWNNEEKRLYVNHFIFEQAKQYADFRGLQKVLIQTMISEPFVGDPVQVTREASDEDACSKVE